MLLSATDRKAEGAVDVYEKNLSFHFGMGRCKGRHRRRIADSDYDEQYEGVISV